MVLFSAYPAAERGQQEGVDNHTAGGSSPAQCGYAMMSSCCTPSGFVVSWPILFKSSAKKETEKKTTVDSFTDIFKTFGDAISEIFSDPELKQKAKDFADSASDSAKTLADRFKDEDVKSKFRDVGKAAEEFGRNIADHFESKEEK